MAKSPAIVCKPLTPGRWDDFCAVMGPNGGYCGCWCMYWRAPRADFAGPARKRLKNRMRAIVEKGPPPGIIAYRGGEPVGWTQVGPRGATQNWNGARRLSAPLDTADADDPAVWGVTCFVVPRAHRGTGVATALLAGAVDYARRKKARALEACPVETRPVEAGEKANPVSIFHGVASMFARAGFREIARRRDDRPLMRLDLSK
ncbi:MAG: GNAT family N-acetyltransferase [Parvularculaceae bacterium]|nr:GNAT family N-acetyltransferase [Parvularculaceae bacterium]HRX40764.1 GNAT family N-acetyltransferase [Parvularculaceae bacterium]